MCVCVRVCGMHTQLAGWKQPVSVQGALTDVLGNHLRARPQPKFLVFRLPFSHSLLLRKAHLDTYF